MKKTRREFLFKCAALMLFSGCNDQMPYRFETNLGIKVMPPNWIKVDDYTELGEIIDKYSVDLHSYFMGNIHDDLIVTIPNKIGSFETQEGIVTAGYYSFDDDYITVAWREENGYPARENILSALPHEINHRWLHLNGLSSRHEDFPLRLWDAENYAKKKSYSFTGDLSKYR